MKRMLFGLVLVLAGAAGLYLFSDPVGTYTAEIAGSGEEVGQLVQADCRDGEAIGRFAGDDRAESECALAEDSVKTTRIVKLAASGVVALLGIAIIFAGYRVWWRDFRSGRAYRRMARDHDLEGRRTER